MNAYFNPWAADPRTHGIGQPSATDGRNRTLQPQVIELMRDGIFEKIFLSREHPRRAIGASVNGL